MRFSFILLGKAAKAARRFTMPNTFDWIEIRVRDVEKRKQGVRPLFSNRNLLN